MLAAVLPPFTTVTCSPPPPQSAPPPHEHHHCQSITPLAYHVTLHRSTDVSSSSHTEDLIVCQTHLFCCVPETPRKQPHGASLVPFLCCMLLLPCSLPPCICPETHSPMGGHVPLWYWPVAGLLTCHPCPVPGRSCALTVIKSPAYLLSLQRRHQRSLCCSVDHHMSFTSPYMSVVQGSLPPDCHEWLALGARSHAHATPTSCIPLPRFCCCCTTHIQTGASTPL